MSGRSLPPSAYVSRIDAALCFAARCHAAQTRKGTQVPYIVHPVHVGWLLQRYGFSEEVVIVGLLHDVLEDTPCSGKDIEIAFGRRIRAMVVELTESDKAAPWETRKEGMLERLRTAAPEVKAVACADKAHNVHTIADALGQGDTGVWSRFRRGAATQIEYFHRALVAIAHGFSHPIVEELRWALARVDG